MLFYVSPSITFRMELACEIISETVNAKKNEKSEEEKKIAKGPPGVGRRREDAHPISTKNDNNNDASREMTFHMIGTYVSI